MLFVCCLYTGVSLAAMTAESPDIFSLEHITTDEGLPQNSIRGLLVDLDGFVWVGTEKGLSRYDGQRFADFSTLVTDIPEDVSLGIELDSKNRIWTSWYAHSLRILSANRSDTIVIEPAEAYPDDLLTMSAPKIVESENGDIWFPGRRHIYRMNAGNNVTSIPVDAQIITDGTLAGNKVVYGTVDGLLLIDIKTETIEYIVVPAYRDNAARKAGYTTMVTAHDNNVTFCHATGVFNYKLEFAELIRIHTDTDLQIASCKQLDTKLLVGATKPGSEFFEIFTLNIKSGKFIDSQRGLPGSATKLNSIGVHDTIVDRDNNHWALLGDALYQASGSDGIFHKLDLPIKPFGIEDVFAQDPSGVVWLRTDGKGLARFSRYSRRFQTTVPPSTISQTNRFRNIAVDRENNVWLSNDERKLLYWNRREDSWTDQLPGNTGTIKGIEILPDGSVWVTIPDIGKLMGFDPKTNSWTHEYQFQFLSTAFSQTPDGHLLAASSNQVILIDPQTGHTEKAANEKLDGQIRAFEQDESGNIWVGTHAAGLVRIDSSGQVKYWTRENSSITSNNIFSLFLDKNNLLWIGTWHGGLLSFDPSTNQFKQYGVDAGLPDSTVFGILEDEAGFLWLSTYAGLVRFSRCPPDDNCRPEVIVFNLHDGLQGDEFDADSHFKSERGELFFAGMNGLNAFYPGTIHINRRPPSIRVSRAQLNGHALPGSESGFVFPGTVRLPFGFSDLRLEISVLDFNNPVKNRMQYRDLNNESSWKDMQQAFLHIRGLNDGTHTFQFRGTNNDGVWSTEYAEIKLLVAAPFYRHPLMMVLYLLLCIFTPMLFFQQRQRRLMETQQALKNEVVIRTRELELANSSRERFFANVSHEICSPVHMILLMLENHMLTASTDDEKLYRSATGYAAQLMVYLKQLVSEARSHELDSHLYAADIAHIINTLVSTNQPIAKARSVSLTINPLPSQRVAFHSSSAISIFSNLLCNALVYTPEHGSIEISGEIKDGFYTFTISNTISEDQSTDIEHMFERGVTGGFNANYFGGHGLGLSIVTSAVEILSGRIDVSLKDKHNILFTLELPLAVSSMPDLPDEADLTFSHEQMLAIKLISEDYQPLPTIGRPQSAITVLIIEDDLLVANMIGQALSQSYTVYVAGSYKDGVHLARKHQPAVIFCDLFLPDESGFEVLKAIRANRMTMNAFFVMVTASISEEDRLRCQELGVDQFVRKPFSAENLKLLITNHTKLSEQRFAYRHKQDLTRKAFIDKVQNTQYSFESRFAEILEDLYQNPDTSIEQIQTRLSMSYNALMKNCKKVFGKSPKRLLIEKRIAVAKNLLTSSEYKIGLISELAGFSTHSQFDIVFKKETGVTPADFRKDPQPDNDQQPS